MITAANAVPGRGSPAFFASFMARAPMTSRATAVITQKPTIDNHIAHSDCLRIFATCCAR